MATKSQSAPISAGEFSLYLPTLPHTVIPQHPQNWSHKCKRSSWFGYFSLCGNRNGSFALGVENEALTTESSSSGKNSASHKIGTEERVERLERTCPFSWPQNIFLAPFNASEQSKFELKRSKTYCGARRSILIKRLQNGRRNSCIDTSNCTQDATDSRTIVDRPKSEIYIPTETEEEREEGESITLGGQDTIVEGLSVERVCSKHEVESKESTKCPQTDSSIRRSWSSVDIPRIKSLFRKSENVERRLTYTPTSSNPQINMEDITRKQVILQQALDNAKQAVPKETIGELSKTCSSIESPEHNARMRWFIIEEIISTEETLHMNLKLLCTAFVEPFKSAANSEKPLVDPADVDIMFAHVEELKNVSNALARDLRLVRGEEAGVGKVFLQHEQNFVAYIRYAINFDNAQKALQRADRNILYRKFIQDSLRNQDCHRLTLSDLMIQPIQRITRSPKIYTFQPSRSHQPLIGNLSDGNGSHRSK
ncbi:uncharacterized protein VTP21DRAFT_413 [Calcarisporiella thermophila]|uniref:uncharacterized protein n=1 Tax=Calcarisporiella thermophila TaxID=911321 RepID=UPI003741F4F5